MPETTPVPAVRRGTADDAAEFVRLRRLIFDDWPFQPDFSVEPDWAERAARVYVDLVAQPRFGVFVMDDPERPGRLAACVSLTIEQHIPGPGGSGRTGYLADMCTEPRLRGRGYGRALLTAALGWAAEQGAAGVHLYATESGRPLYEALGFRSGGPFEHMTSFRD